MKKEHKITLQRTPIVAVLGHVDHGKTTLLDAIRNTNVTASEAGGITQNVRAHQITYHGQKITFIDTPGHEAFAQMRSRGAKVTDIALIVVAIDDGVQPQTKQSIKFAQEEKVPILIAINKIDLPGKTTQKIKQELANAGVLLEEFGGEVMSAEVSALKKIGLDELLERILLLAEISELKKISPKDCLGQGYVLEANLDKNLGPVSLIIVKSGEIKPGNFLVYEGGYAKVRALLNEAQSQINISDQGDPIWVIGLNKVLQAGTTVKAVATGKAARQLEKTMSAGAPALEDFEEKVAKELEKDKTALAEEDLELLSQLYKESKSDEDIKYVNIILKASTMGTLEAVKEELTKLNDEEVQTRILDAATGQITEQDVARAKLSKGIVIGFQAPMSKRIAEVAKKERVLVKNYDVIYDLTDEISEVMDSLVQPTEIEEEVARASIKKVFVLSNGQTVAGAEVTNGNVVRGYKVYVERNGKRIGNAKITLLKQQKTEVKEVKKGQDCGILLEPQIEVAEGDEIVCVKVEKV